MLPLSIGDDLNLPNHVNHVNHANHANQKSENQQNEGVEMYCANVNPMIGQNIPPQEQQLPIPTSIPIQTPKISGIAKLQYDFIKIIHLVLFANGEWNYKILYPFSHSILFPLYWIFMYDYSHINKTYFSYKLTVYSAIFMFIVQVYSSIYFGYMFCKDNMLEKILKAPSTVTTTTTTQLTLRMRQTFTSVIYEKQQQKHLNNLTYLYIGSFFLSILPGMFFAFPENIEACARNHHGTCPLYFRLESLTWNYFSFYFMLQGRWV
jgi:hypothetical protein